MCPWSLGIQDHTVPSQTQRWLEGVSRGSLTLAWLQVPPLWLFKAELGNVVITLHRPRLVYRLLWGSVGFSPSSTWSFQAFSMRTHIILGGWASQHTQPGWSPRPLPVPKEDSSRAWKGPQAGFALALGTEVLGRDNEVGTPPFSTSQFFAQRIFLWEIFTH